MITNSKTIIESVGCYLPPQQVSTAEIIKACRNPVNLPLERLTGIRSRHRAGESEFAIDLAEKAVRDCLSRSVFKLNEIDMIVSTNISRWDGRNQVFFEPPTACRLKRRIGLPAHCKSIDISNACAGMWTGVFLVDALIRSGEIGCGIVVSGEYITHLIDTAQKEVADFMDSQVASLTLGDAGVAVTLSRGASDASGLVDLELYTLSKLSRFCIAKPTDKSHGGAAMLTDSIRVSEAVIPQAAKHAKKILQKNNWGHERVQHIIPHQTSELTMRAGMREIRRLIEFDYTDRLISNLAMRGNTSSNAHFLALHDAMQNQTIRAGDSVVFCISGSGQTMGTALYVLDDLPTRVQNQQKNVSATSGHDSFVLPVQFEIESFGLVQYPGKDEPDTVEMISAAAKLCLERSSFAHDDIELLIAASTYRSEFLMEPAIAALAAGALEINHDREPTDEKSTFAFDITNGEVGFLKAVYLATELARAGELQTSMVVASEVENNCERCPEHLLGIRPMASAIMLREATGESGFLSFGFTDYVEHDRLREVHAGWHENGSRIYLTCEDHQDLLDVMLECAVRATLEFLANNDLSVSDIRWLLPSQHSSHWMQQFAKQLGFAAECILDLDPDNQGNPMTSSFPLALEEGLESGRLQAGDLVLISNVCPGVQVGCAVYRI